MNKTKIQKYKDALQLEHKELTEDLMHSNENLSGLNPNIDGDLADKAYSTYEKELLIGLSENEKETIKSIELALKKIDNNTYGLCESCNKNIEEQRLDAIPYATLCVTCKKNNT